nr:AMP-binding protein [uncultured Cupriavidus sp.]
MTEHHNPSPYWPKGLPFTQYVPHLTLTQCLEVSALKFPDKPAYVVYGHEITYANLLAQTQRLAAWLQQRAGVRRGERVLLSAQSSVQFVIAYHAILRADAVAVLANPMCKGAELAHLAEDSGAKYVIAGQEMWPQLEGLTTTGVDQVLLFAYREALPGASDGDAPDWFVDPPRLPTHPAVTGWTEALSGDLLPWPAEASPDDLCLIAYTSGTTAHPKGCTHTHRSILTGAVTTGNWRGDTSETVILGASPMFHMLGLQSLVNTSVYLGATCVLLPRWDARKAAELIPRYRVNRWGATPPMLLDLLGQPSISERAFDSLVCITGGGAALPETVNRRLSQELGIHYIEGYGMTETAAMVMATPPQRPKRQCLGIPTAGVSAMVVDPVTLESYADGCTKESGELWIAGDQISPGGYWNNDEANQTSFVMRDGKRWLRTGDLVVRDAEGYYFLVDRLKRMINVGGYKVWPTEVESLLHGHPAIQEACVISVSDPRRGESVRAVVVLRDGHQLTAEDLISWARANMATYKCPREVVFTDRLLRSPTGKIDWRRMQEQANEVSAQAN